MDMKQLCQLKPEQLRRTIDPKQFDFETTAEVPALSSILGQPRGTKVMQFALHMKQDGYNIYVAGPSGTGKTTFTRSIIEDFAKQKTTLYDWCYVYNFDEPTKPRVLKLQRGRGRLLKDDMETLLKNLNQDIPRAFEEESYTSEREQLIATHEAVTTQLAKEMEQHAKKAGFLLQAIRGGLATVPIKKGKPLTEEEFAMLDQEEIDIIEQKSNQVQPMIQSYMDQIREIELTMTEQLDALDKQVALGAAGYHLNKLKESYADETAVLEYIEKVQEDILKNIDTFVQYEETKEEALVQLLTQSRQTEAHHEKYEVNLFIHHEKTEGAPVIIAENPTYYNVVGKVEYESRMGVMSTDFTHIRPGYLHQANGGYLIIQVLDILTNNYAWEGLKRALLHKELTIENIAESAGLMATTSLQPEPIPLDVKVIFIGNSYLYQLLYEQDEDFRKLFKMKVDFDIDMQATYDNMNKLARFIHTRSERDGLLHFTKDAVAALVEYSMRISDHQQKMSTQFNEQVEIIYEANTWATLDGATLVNKTYVEQAIEERHYRNRLYEEKVQEQIEDGSIFIDTEGDMIGQVNGLAVYDLGQYRFGKPSRITATTFSGNRGIVNIERESKLSGNIHNKGMYILEGYVGETFAQKEPLSLTAHIAFEQSYGGVDGDSASSTELYALLSSLAKVPLQQGIAVTGSVNQKGEIQPIGGVNEKIEGFFDLCQSRHLTGSQGVMIPYANIQNLMLREDIGDAVQKGKFHIYAVQTIEQGIEILTNLPAGRQEDGSFLEGSVYAKVQKRLAQFATLSRSKKQDH